MSCLSPTKPTTKNHITGPLSVCFPSDHEVILPVIIMVQFAEDDRENEPLESWR